MTGAGCKTILQAEPLTGERQEPWATLVGSRHQREPESSQRRRLVARQPRADPRAEVRHERDARATTAHRVGHAIPGPADVRHPVEGEADVPTPGVVDPVSG